MPGFEVLEQAIPQGTAQQPILPDEVRFADEGDWSDETALGIVIADIDAGIAYEQAKNFITTMELSDDFIRGYVRIRPWPNSDKPRSALSMPIVLEGVEKSLKKAHLAMWGSGKEPYLVTPVGKTKPEAANAWQSLLRWASRVSDLEEESRLCMKGILTYGWDALRGGWKTITKVKRSEKYRKNDETGEIERNPDAKSQEIAHPTVEAVNLRNIILDPTCPSHDPRKAKWWAVRSTINAYDLDDMRQDPMYDGEFEDEDAETGERKKSIRSKIPTRIELADILANKQEPAENSMIATQPNQTREFQKQDDRYPMSKDPLLQPLEIVEYHHQTGRIVTMLQRKIIIRNEKEKKEQSNLFGCAFIDVLNSLFGWGIGRLLGGEQRFQQGVLNTWVDGLALSLNPAFQQVKGMAAGNQNISIAPGKVVTIETELKPLVVQDVSQSAQNAIDQSDLRIAKRIGMEGGTAMPTQAMRTGSGVQAFQGDNSEAIQYFTGIYCKLVLVPILKYFLEHICENLSPEQINQILSDEDGKEYAGDILDIYNADVKIEIASGSKLQVRQAAAQAAPLVIQLISNQAVQQQFSIAGIKFNFAEFLKEYLELTGWDVGSLIQLMTPEDIQRMTQLNQAAQRNQGRLQEIAAQHQADLDTVDAKAAGQAVQQIVKGHIQNAIEPPPNAGPVQ